jgi:hypothetical protein
MELLTGLREIEFFTFVRLKVSTDPPGIEVSDYCNSRLLSSEALRFL